MTISKNSVLRGTVMAGIAALSMGAVVVATTDTAQARGFGGGGAVFRGGGGFHGGFGRGGFGGFRGGRIAGFRGGYGGFRDGRFGYGVGAAALGYGLASAYGNGCSYGYPYGNYGGACGYGPYGYAY